MDRFFITLVISLKYILKTVIYLFKTKYWQPWFLSDMKKSKFLVIDLTFKTDVIKIIDVKTLTKAH